MAPISYLALGDSYTIGEQVAEAERFPIQVAAMLREKGYPVKAPEIIAATGWTTAELERGIAAAHINNIFDIVTLLIGVNNQYRGRSLDEYKAAFTTLLRQAIGFAGNRSRRVVALSIPDWSVTPFAAGRDRVQIAAEVAAFNAASKAIAAQWQTAYLDITPFTREAAVDNDLLAVDGLHPSGKDYRRWARALLPLVERALQ